MKRAKLPERLPRILACTLLTGLLAVSWLLLPAPPAHAMNQYFIDISISEDLTVKNSIYSGQIEELSASYGSDSKEICKHLVQEQNARLQDPGDQLKKFHATASMQVDKCTFSTPYFFIEYSGKLDEETLKKPEKIKPGNTPRPKFNEEGDLVIYPEIPWDLPTYDGKTGIIRYTFPDKIKSVSPGFGKISGNTWTLDKPLTEEQDRDFRMHGEFFTITAQIHSSKLWLILGITIPAALIILTVVVVLAIRRNHKKKQQNPVGKPVPGYSGYPPQAPLPSATLPPMPGASPQGGYPPRYGYFPPASYPPNAPQGQPEAPAQGGYYPYPYPPLNPQNPGAWNSPMPNQGYSAPTPGFPVPQASSGSARPGTAAAPEPPEQPGRPKHAAFSPQPGQSGEPGKPE